jgi:hypothetical protein
MIPIQWLTGALSLGLKRLEREFDRPLQISVEIKKNVDLFIHPLIRLHDIVLN